VTTVDADGSVAVEREMTGGGSYDGLDVPREAGDIAETSLKEGPMVVPDDVPRARWDGARDVCQRLHAGRGVPGRRPPATYLHVDVMKHPDGTVERVDDDELRDAEAAGDVPEPLAEKARSVASALENAL